MRLGLPLAAMLAMALAFAALLQRTSPGGLQYFEIGLVFGAVVLLYGCYPLVSFLVRGQTFSALDDVRLFTLQPKSDAIASVGWAYVTLLACFCLAYLVARRSSTLHRAVLTPTRWEVIVAIVLLLVLIQAFFTALGAFFGGTPGEGYGDRYRAYLHLPKFIHQVANHLDGVVLALNLLLITALMTRWNQTRGWVLAWLAVEIGAVLLLAGSRTRVILLLIGFAVNFHYLVRPLRFRELASFAALGLLFFLGLGVLRASSLAAGAETTGTLFTGGTEFESLFINAIDLQRLKDQRMVDEILPALYFADLLRLVPQQLLPWQKLDLADWYVNTFYPDYAKIGGGLAFGTVAEATIGAGALDLMWRGVALGAIFGMLQRFIAQTEISYWRFSFYVWVLLLSYQSLRNTTFSLLPMFTYQFLPAVLGTATVAGLVRGLAVARQG